MSEASNENKQREQEVIYRFPVKPVRVPQFTNASVINYQNGQVIIEFGYIDTYPNEEDEQKGFVDITPVTRIVMDVTSTQQLFSQVFRLFEALGITYTPLVDAIEKEQDSQ